ncbi:CDP-glycerol glycerophosphotransferase family protein [Peribacillus simplex]|uniref:CDP-glycerol glycerophosphotransferase family protein n=1 Tax=Peribacillus simplex TaxID=1478 RepID=UPI0037C52EC9
MVVFLGRKKYNDSPQGLYEYICQENHFDGYRITLAFKEPNKYSVGRAQKVRIDTVKFFIAALSSKYWISNSAVERN